MGAIPQEGLCCECSGLAHLVDDGEAHRGVCGQAVGEVLHHALQPRAALEGRARVVPVLGVHKLRDDALRGLQRGQIALRLQQQLVDVPCAAPLLSSAVRHGNAPLRP